jgi:ribonuclease P protein component
VSAGAPKGKANVSSGRRIGARFPRCARLLRHSDFERVYKQGRRYFAAHMTAFYLPRTAGEGTRVGFTAGRVLGGAVERNRIKRRLREAVRLCSGTMSLPADVVINAKKSLLTVEFEELRREVEQAFAMIGQKAAPPNRR